MLVLERRKRRVSFGGNYERVFEKDYTKADKGNIWYNGNEMQAFKTEIFSMIRFDTTRVSNVLDKDSKVAIEIDLALAQWNWRGLEHLHTKRSRKEIRKRHSNDFLHFRDHTKSKDPVQLAIYARANTKCSSKRARDFAISDEKDALEIHNEGRDAVASLKEPEPEIAAEQQHQQPEQSIVVPVLGMSICRGQSCLVGVPALPIRAEENTLSQWVASPYNMIAIMLPCLC